MVSLTKATLETLELITAVRLYIENLFSIQTQIRSALIDGSLQNFLHHIASRYQNILIYNAQKHRQEAQLQAARQQRRQLTSQQIQETVLPVPGNEKRYCGRVRGGSGKA